MRVAFSNKLLFRFAILSIFHPPPPRVKKKGKYARLYKKMKASRGGTFNVDLADVIKSPEVKIEKKKYVVLSNASSSSGKRDRDIVLINCK